MQINRINWARFMMTAITLLFVFGAFSFSTFAQQYKGSPVTKARLVNVLRLKKVPAKEILQIVNRKGVDFQVTPAVEKELAAAGANPAIIAAARASFRTSTEKVDPNFEKATALFESGRFAEAANAFKAVLARQPSAETNYNIGLAYENLEQFNEAVKYFGEAVRLDPKDPDAWQHYGFSLINLEKNQEALEAYKNFVSLKPDSGDGWVQIGDAFYALENYPEAIRAYQKGVQLDPTIVDGWRSLGDSLNEMENYTLAAESYQKAVRLDAADGNAWSGLGKALLNAERYKEALDACKQATKLLPEDAEAWYNLGAVYYNLGNYANAVAAYQKAVQLDPDDEEAIQALQDAQKALRGNR
jgi:tetratricopeptide (TPR) repeat protein